MAMVDTSPRSPVVQAVQLLIIIAAMMWVIEAFDTAVLEGRLDQQGIVPRTLRGLDGILWAPMLHGGFGHLLANTLPFVVLGAFVALEGLRRWLVVTAFVVVVGGLATWLFARPAAHVGASGLIFGYAGFLLVAGFVERSIKGIAVSIVVGLLFGGMVLRGITPVSNYVSWESHLFGLAAGVLAAFALATPESERTLQSP
ncbi:MAG: rhomboid family intramembrane serine protease [Acidimicrobiia bacterium]|nr:rhomboid family intramembrane serine protease [Acidimicrobiia bacterium]